MRRLLAASCSGLLVVLVAFGLLISAAHAQTETAEETAVEAEETYVDPYGLNISAECAILVDASSGCVLYEKNAEQRHLIASTTKIMTAIVALEKAEDLDATVTIPDDWMGVEGSSMYLQAGANGSFHGFALSFPRFWVIGKQAWRISLRSCLPNACRVSISCESINDAAINRIYSK